MSTRMVIGVFVLLACALPANAQTAVELQAELNALLQQLATLQAQLQTNTGSANTLPAVSGAYGSCPALLRTLERGSEGSDVTALQAFLAADARIYPEGTISGYFGSLTETAVQRFQVRHGIVTSGSPATTGYGVVGPKTRTTIQSLCSTPGTLPTNPITPNSSGTCTVGGVAVATGNTYRFYSTQQAPMGSTCAAFSAIRQCINGVLSGNAAYQYANCTEAAPQTCNADGVNLANGTTFTFYTKRTVTTSGETCAQYSQSRTCQNGSLTGNASYQYLTCTVDALESCAVGSTTVAHGQSRVFYKQTAASGSNTCSSYAQSRTCTDGTLSGSNEYQYTSCTAGGCSVGDMTLANGETRTFYFAEHIPSSEQCSSYAQTRTCSNGNLTGNSSYRYASCAPAAAGTCVVDSILLQSGESASFYSTSTAPIGASCGSYVQTRICSGGTLSGGSSYNRASCSDMKSCSLSGVTVLHGQSYTFYSASTVNFGTTCSSRAQTRVCSNGLLSGSATYQYASCSVNPPTSDAGTNAQLAAALAALESLLRDALTKLDSWF